MRLSVAKRLQVLAMTKALLRKYPGPEFGKQRFAGDVFKGLGVEGVFGQMSNDKAEHSGSKQPSVVHEPVHERIVLANPTRTTMPPAEA